jgi:hypothetical protein
VLRCGNPDQDHPRMLISLRHWESPFYVDLSVPEEGLYWVARLGGLFRQRALSLDSLAGLSPLGVLAGSSMVLILTRL